MMGESPAEHPVRQLFQALNRWLGTSVGNAFGNPLEERRHQPPPVGVQPYRDHPHH
jgi:hypothetical protein